MFLLPIYIQFFSPLFSYSLFLLLFFIVLLTSTCFPIFSLWFICFPLTFYPVLFFSCSLLRYFYLFFLLAPLFFLPFAVLSHVPVTKFVRFAFLLLFPFAPSPSCVFLFILCAFFLSFFPVSFHTLPLAVMYFFLSIWQSVYLFPFMSPTLTHYPSAHPPTHIQGCHSVSIVVYLFSVLHIIWTTHSHSLCLISTWTPLAPVL